MLFPHLSEAVRCWTIIIRKVFGVNKEELSVGALAIQYREAPRTGDFQKIYSAIVQSRKQSWKYIIYVNVSKLPPATKPPGDLVGRQYVFSSVRCYKLPDAMRRYFNIIWNDADCLYEQVSMKYQSDQFYTIIMKNRIVSEECLQ